MEKDDKDQDQLLDILRTIRTGDSNSICKALGDFIELTAGEIRDEHLVACMSLAIAQFTMLKRPKEEVLEIVGLAYDRTTTRFAETVQNIQICEKCGDKMSLGNNREAKVLRVLWCRHCSSNEETAFIAQLPVMGTLLVVLRDGAAKYYPETALASMIENYEKEGKHRP